MTYSFVGLHAHGGFCCGVTHMYLGEYQRPDATRLPACEKFNYEKPEETSRGIAGCLPRKSGESLKQVLVYPACQLTLTRPVETPGERLDAFLEAFYPPSKRGLIEVVVTHGQLVGWRTWLEARGFKEVASGVNSNSLRTLYMFIAVKGKG